LPSVLFLPTPTCKREGGERKIRATLAGFIFLLLFSSSARGKKREGGGEEREKKILQA
jgi:hypothetical protein